MGHSRAPLACPLHRQDVSNSGVAQTILRKLIYNNCVRPSKLICTVYTVSPRLLNHKNLLRSTWCALEFAKKSVPIHTPTAGEGLTDHMASIAMDQAGFTGGGRFRPPDRFSIRKDRWQCCAKDSRRQVPARSRCASSGLHNRSTRCLDAVQNGLLSGCASGAAQPVKENSIDLVFVINGIPVATVELKSDFTHTIHNTNNKYPCRPRSCPRPEGRGLPRNRSI